jgi:hypothetical protein
MAYIASTSPDLQCQATTKQGNRCGNIPKGRHNGQSLCARHLASSIKTFADAQKRWKDAGEPESDL